LLKSPDILGELLSLKDEELFSYFKDLANLDFYLNRHGMQSKHLFTVIDHTKRLLKNFQKALVYRDEPELMATELTGGTSYQKDFYKRVVDLIESLDLERDSDDFRIIVLVLLLHDVGKGTYDKNDAEIRLEARESGNKTRKLSFDYLTLLYRTKDHEERGAFMVYSLLEEVEGISQSFATRVKNLIMGHGDFSKLQTEKDFNFLVFLRRIMDYTTVYNYPMIRQNNPDELLIHELQINYLIFLIDIYSVDDQGKVWHSVGQMKETIFLKAKWFLGKKVEDMMLIISEQFPDWEDKKYTQVFTILKNNFLRSLRANSSLRLEGEFTGICTVRERKELAGMIHSFLDHTEKMYPLYLHHTTSHQKLLHISMLSETDGELSYEFESPVKDKMDIHLVKRYAPEGTLLKIVKCLINGSIRQGRTLKIIKMRAYSGLDNRLVDVITLKHSLGEAIDKESIDILRESLTMFNDPGYKMGRLDLPLTASELDSRIESIHVELNDVAIGSRRFQELKIQTGKLSNLVLYSCLTALSYINIIDVKVEPVDSGYVYAFLLSQMKSYKITSTNSFKEELIEQLNQNVLITN
ncbi:MAG: hypothetical protein OEZ36_10485, partial [Spirochaetota bacterium]|nr:hypothetical protein [Spirochaetota bacterium]